MKFALYVFCQLSALVEHSTAIQVGEMTQPIPSRPLLSPIYAAHFAGSRVANGKTQGCRLRELQVGGMDGRQLEEEVFNFNGNLVIALTALCQLRGDMRTGTPITTWRKSYLGRRQKDLRQMGQHAALAER